MVPSKAWAASSVTSMPASSGKAQSNSSSAVPSGGLTASGISSSFESDRRVGPEHLAGRDPEQQRISDLTGSTRNSHTYW